jgi:hypothetical protein
MWWVDKHWYNGDNVEDLVIQGTKKDDKMYFWPVAQEPNFKYR